MSIISSNSLRELGKGAFWSAAGRYTNYITQFLVIAVLSRLLDAEDFGILSMVVVYTGFLNILAEGGLTNAVIHLKKINVRDFSTVFWLALFFSLLIYFFTFLIAPLIESFYAMNGLADVVRVVSIGIVFMSLSAVPEGLMKRRLLFKKITLSDGLPAVFSGSLAIYLAMYFEIGYWALVVNVLGVQFFKFILILVVSKWRPFFEFKYAIVKKVLSFSSYLIGFNSINYWARNADNLLIGKFLGATSLGFYNQAYKLMMMPIQLITSVLNAALLPVMSSVQDSVQEMAAIYKQAFELLVLISFVVGGFLYINADLAILLAWGDKWEASIPIFKVLSLLTIFQPIVSTLGSVLTARGKASLLFKLGVLNSTIMVVGIVIGLRYGSLGVAYGYMISYLAIVMPQAMFFIFRTLSISFKDVMRHLYYPLTFMLVYCLGLSGGRHLFLINKESISLYFLFCFLFAGIALYILYAIRYKKIYFSIKKTIN